MTTLGSLQDLNFDILTFDMLGNVAPNLTLRTGPWQEWPHGFPEEQIRPRH
jgi:hypothetical protein